MTQRPHRSCHLILLLRARIGVLALLLAALAGRGIHLFHDGRFRLLALGLGACANQTPTQQRVTTGAAIGALGGAAVGAIAGGGNARGRCQRSGRSRVSPFRLMVTRISISGRTLT